MPITCPLTLGFVLSAVSWVLHSRSYSTPADAGCCTAQLNILYRLEICPALHDEAQDCSYAGGSLGLSLQQAYTRSLLQDISGQQAFDAAAAAAAWSSPQDSCGRQDACSTPLMCAALFLWPYRPYLSFADVDEFLLIQKPGQNVSDVIADPACYNGAHQIAVPHHQVSHLPVSCAV